METERKALFLLASGLAGSLVKVVLNPEPSLARLTSRMIVGVLAAVFLGGLISQVIINIFKIPASDGLHAICAAGFICGVAVEEVLEFLTRKIGK